MMSKLSPQAQQLQAQMQRAQMMQDTPTQQDNQVMVMLQSLNSKVDAILKLLQGQ